jgi:DNA polymerase III subunit beta
MTITETRPPVTTQDATPVRSFQLPASMLRDAASVVVAASKDATLPSLCVVRIEVTSEGVTFAATDRYRLAVGTVRWSEGATARYGADDWAVSVDAKALTAAVKSLPKADKYGRHSEAQVFVNLTPTGVEIVHPTGTTVLPVVELDFPRWRALVPAEDATVAVESIAWNPAYMADVAKLPTTRNRPIRWTFYGETRPACARFGGGDDVFTWLYLLMPVRLAG